MVKKIQLLLALCAITTQFYAQDYLAVPSENHSLTGVEKSELNGDKASVFEENFIYLYDTLNLPFIDDFSTNRQRKRITDLTSNRLSDSVFYKLFSGGRPFPDTIGFTLDTTFVYSLNNLGDTIVSTPNFAITISYSELIQPIEYFEYEVFPAFNIANRAGGTSDTVYVPVQFRQDSVTFYTVQPSANDLWTDGSAFINRTFAIDPPTIGVATFDGLNELGQPYNINTPLTVIADYLSSVPLDLENIPDTNVYLSFYYQPKGLAIDKPERADSLIVEFYNAQTQRWTSAWNTIGFGADTFSQAIIKVPEFLQQNGFRFRFKNYANSSGAFDQWHIDYVHLDNNRTEIQDFYEDIAYVYDAPSMLTDYYAMPYWHFRNNPANYMSDSAFTFVRNLSDNRLLIFNFLNVPDTSTGTNFYAFPPPNSSSPVRADTIIRFEYPTPFEFPANKVNGEIIFESIFDIQFRPRTDLIRSNDTVISKTVLEDYYAYDDGTAEAGYGVNPALSADGLTAYMAIQYDIPFEDTLKGFQTYFLPQAVDVTKQTIKLSVWSSLNPASLLYEREVSAMPVFSEPNGLITYSLDTPLVVPQTFFIGFKTIGANSVNVGYDLNTNHKDKMFFSQNGTSWSTPTSGIKDGSLMLRPVFRSRVFDVGLNAIHTNEDLVFGVYPNPSSGIVNLKVDDSFKADAVTIYTISGKVVYQEAYSSQIDLNGFPKGIYVVRVRSVEGAQLTKKLILSH